MIWLLAPLAAVAVVALAMVVWRQLDHYADRAAWAELVATKASDGEVFDPAMIADLPEPAQRYFTFSIAPGTPLRTIATLRMTGEIGQGTKGKHSYQAMQADQILAPPHGLVWTVKAGPLSGSDAAMPDRSWTRFWLVNLMPVVRVDGADHLRSAFGRVIAEAAIWVPASLLPSDNVTWEPVDDDTARATVRYGDFEQAVDITVDPSGAPVEFLIQRWSNENPDKTFRLQPFGGTAARYEMFDGYRLPTRVIGGNHFGTPDYFAFFKADVLSITMIE